jgi:iron complex outermembrane receptor protein
MVDKSRRGEYMMENKLILACGVALAAVSAGGPATAQGVGGPTPSTPASSDDTTVTVNKGGAATNPSQAGFNNSIADIVVTARKRAAAETLQKTPITASAFVPAQLAKTASVNLRDVGRLTPNVSFQPSNQVGQQNFNIRGIGVSGSTVADEPAVGVIQDGVYIANKGGSVTELFDLASVQVLLGPQGTLFGRNVTGGAVIVESQKPQFNNIQHVNLGYGNGNTKDAQAILNAPIIDGTLAARLAVLYRDTDGLYHDALNGGHYGKDKTWLVRPSFLFNPSDNLSILWRNEYYSIHGQQSATRGAIPSTVPGAPISSPQAAGYTEPSDFYSIQTNPTYTNQDIYSTTLEADLQLLGGVLTSITGYRALHVELSSDFDGTPLEAFRTSARTRQHQVSTELRYARKVGDWLNFTSGVYYFDQAFTEKDKRNLDQGATKLATNAQLKDDHSFAAFTEADITPIRNLTLTVGGRYTSETKVAQLAPYGACSFDFSNCVFGAEKSATFHNFSPKASLSYQITPNNLVYGSVTKGFRSGGFSLSVAGPLGAPYKPEKVTQYEIGAKNDFFNHHLRVNLSGYYSDYKDIQRVVIASDPVIGVVTSTFNAAAATIYGGELTINLQATNWLRFDGVYGYTHARYNQFLGFADPKALRFVRVPTNTGSISATASHNLADGAQLEAVGVATFTSGYFFDDVNQQSQKAYHLVDATLTYRPASKKYSVSVYGRNLANKGYALWGSYLGARGQNLFLGSPRSYGVSVGFDF